MKVKATINNMSELLLKLVIVVSVLTQITPISGVLRIVMYACWGVLLCYLLIRKDGVIKTSGFLIHFVGAYIAFLAYCIIAALFGKEHLNGRYLDLMVIPLIVTFVGGQIRADKKALEGYAKMYLLAALILAVWVHLTYFASYSLWLTQMQYAFAQKNSAGQIWVTAVLVGLALIRPENRWERLAYYGVYAYLLIMVALSQCRTAMLAVGCVAVVMILFRTKHRFRWLLLLGILAVAAWLFPPTRAFVDKALFLTKYQGTDLNTFSSGRIDNYIAALEVFAASPFIGAGRYYVDCSYISILAESGLIGFFLIESIWVHKIYDNLVKVRRDRALAERNLLLALTVFYLVESVLESQPPFGPGASSFMFWMVSAIILKNRQVTITADPKEN